MGGDPRAEARARRAGERGPVAGFSRALTEGLRVDMTPDEFDKALAESVTSIYAASTT